MSERGLMKTRSAEAQRDQNETSFTPILRRLYASVPWILSAAFVDDEGECIDYVSSIDPYDAKVNAAHMFVLLEIIRHSDKLNLRHPFMLEINGSERELWARRVGGDYVLVVVLQSGADRSQLTGAVQTAGREFRVEAGIEAPPWDPDQQSMEVSVRSATGWDYAPASLQGDGMKVSITDVIGRWTEAGGVAGEELVCFRVRTEDGNELTLVHDPDVDGWLVRM